MEIIAQYGDVLLVLAVVFGLFMAWGVGANDVANAKTNNTSPYCAIISIRSPYLASNTSNREPTF